MPADPVFLPGGGVLRFDELLRLCAIFAENGVKTFRVTGGEPLLRKGVITFIRKLKASPGVERVTLTTNGALLAPHVGALSRLGIDGINVSLDSADPDIYRRITGRDDFHNAWRSITLAIGAGIRVKLNCVPIRGINDGDILRLARLAETLPVDVRFIELMPTDANADSGAGMNPSVGENQGVGMSSGAGAAERRYRGVPSAEVADLLAEAYPDLSPDHTRRGSGPARYFKSARFKGGVGLIDAVSGHFCESCNRLRLTSEGFLRLCLFSGEGADLRAMLRNGADDAAIEAAVKEAVFRKPERRGAGCSGDNAGCVGRMSRIGG